MAWYDDARGSVESAARSGSVKGGSSSAGMPNWKSSPVKEGAGNWWDKITGRTGEREDKSALENQMNAQTQEQYGFEKEMSKAENDNVQRMRGFSADYQKNIRGIMGEDDAKNAMTLQQAQDPNNPVAQSFRNMYSNQAQNEGKSGLADVGVMQALGAQAFGGQMGGGAPITGGQMQAMMAQNQSQAGQAFANVQKRKQSLQDQGVAQGIMQTQAAWDRGQQAKDRAERGYKDIYGNQAGMSGLESDVISGSAQRRAGIAGGLSAAEQSMIASEMANKAQGRQQMLGGLVSAVGPWSGAQGIGTGMGQSGSAANMGGQQQQAGQGTAGGAQAFGGLMGMLGHNKQTTTQNPNYGTTNYNQRSFSSGSYYG